MFLPHACGQLEFSRPGENMGGGACVVIIEFCAVIKTVEIC